MGLTPFQIAAAQLFFSLDQSDGFLLAGGAALIAQRLVDRPTRDLDLFTRTGRGSIPAARDAFESAAHARNWTTRCIRDSSTFCRLVVTADLEDIILDLALDAPPADPAAPSPAGPTFSHEELAGRKLIALFDRAEARDFADVYALAQRFGTDVLLHEAARIDAGFDPSVLATMIGSINRFTDDEIPAGPDTISDLRRFYRRWQEQLRREEPDK